MADLVVDHVRKSYPTRSTPLDVLRDISLELSAGESLAITGPSGCGKSTLLHILGTLDRPTSGRVILHGEDPFSWNADQLARFRQERVGFIFQDHHLLPQLSAYENILLPALAAGPIATATQRRAQRLLQQMGLGDREQHRPAELSGGERQRVAIARALLNNPSLLLADEPTGNLDGTTADEITEILLELPHHTTPAAILIVVTHSKTLASRLGRELILDGGKLHPPDQSP